MYNINFNDIALKLTPPFLRKEKFSYLLFALISPLNAIKTAFNEQLNHINYKLQFNGQVIYLEHYLNDLYDNVNRKIYIEDVANIEQPYLFNKAEQRPLFVFNKSENNPVYLKNIIEFNNAIDFVIKVPVGVTYNEMSMRNKIDYYKVLGKSYTIQTY